MFGTKAALRCACIIFLGLLLAPHIVDAQLKIRFPLPNQTFYPDRVLRLEWSNSEAIGVDVLFSQDQGTSWTRMAAGLQDSAFDWRLPLLDTSSLTFKIQEASLEKPQEFQRISHERGCVSARWDAHDRYIISTLDTSILELRSSDNLVAMATLPLGGEQLVPAQSYSMHPDTTISAEGKELILLNIAAFGNPVRFRAEEHASDILCLSVHPNKEIVATATADGRVYLWSIPERRVIRSFGSQMRTAIRCVRFSEDGQRILYAGDEGIIFVRDVFDSTTDVVELRGHGDGGRNMAVLCAAFCPDGHHIISGGVDYTIREWDMQYAYCNFVMYGHKAPVNCLQISSDGTRILSGSMDSTVRQWSVAAGRELHPALVMNDAVSSVDYTLGADTLLASERHSGTTVLWKNIRETGSSDSVSGFVSYPVSVRICNTKALVGQFGYIPIVFDSVVSVPFFERASFKATLGLTVPRRIVSVESSDPSIVILHGDERDTVYMPIVFSSNDTVGRIPVRFLLSDDLSDQVQILPGLQAIQWSNTVHAFTLDHTTNGTVSSEKECPQTARGGLSMLSAEDATVLPTPANDHATLRFSTYEEGHYRVEILNELGMLVYQLVDATLGRSAQEFQIPTADLASGNYYVRVYAPSTTTTRSLLVVH